MSRRKMVQVLRTSLGEHPAALAWTRLGGGAGVPSAINPISLKKKSQVYRLIGAGPDGGNIVAKHCRRSTAMLESAIYERILSALPIGRLTCYGVVDEASGPFAWLLLDDAGDHPYDGELDAHRRLASTWLAHLHTGAAALGARAWLPDRGPDAYHAHLRSARANILAVLEHGGLDPDRRAVLRAAVARCDLIDAFWEKIGAQCMGIPATLVHGDLAAKNLRVGLGAGPPALFVMDWEMAGWGIPLGDLAKCPLLDAYQTATQDSWPGIDRDRLAHLALIGKLFRLLAAMDWSSQSLIWLDAPCANKSFLTIPIYLASLAALCEELNIHDARPFGVNRPCGSRNHP